MEKEAREEEEEEEELNDWMKSGINGGRGGIEGSWWSSM